MSPKSTPFTLLYCTCVLSFCLFSCSQQSESESIDSQPNIVFIFTDDQAFDALRSAGNEEIITPHMDRLAEMGTTFTHAYNMGAWGGAVCVASRAMLNSGRSLWRVQKFQEFWTKNDSSGFDHTWARLMKDAGYDTYMTGKWHVRAPASSLFDTVKHVRPGMPPDAGFGPAWRMLRDTTDWRQIDLSSIMPNGYNRPLSESDTSWLPHDTSKGGFWKGGKHWSEVVKDNAIEFIDQASGSENPFFMYLAFNAPHDPRQSPKEFLDMYPMDKISLPESFLPNYEWQDSIGLGPALRDEALAPFPRTKFAVRKHIQEYYAIITHLDRQIGSILDALEEKGMMENTYVIFTSDHGLGVGRHGLLGKQNMYDHSVRVPLIIAGPEIPTNEKLSGNVYMQDVMPTALALSGSEIPEYVEFTSLLDRINGTTDFNKTVYGAYMNDQRMVRKDGYKLIVYPRANKILLYDLTNDPNEMNDLSEDAAYKEKIVELFEALLSEQEKWADDLDLSGFIE